jgi:hypothetical protein
VLRLIAFFDGEPPAALDGALLARFLCEFYAVTERAPPDADPELGPLVAAIPDAVALAHGA